MKKKFSPGTAIVIGLSIFAIFMFSVIFMAFNTKVDLVANNYYDKSIAFQDDINNQDNANALGANVSIKQNQRTIIITIPIDSGFTPSGTISLFRPSDSTHDTKFNLSVDSKGKQIIDMSSMAQGYWKVKLDWQSKGKTYQKEEKIVL